MKISGFISIANYTAESTNAGMDLNICDQLTVPLTDTGTANEICIFTANDTSTQFSCDVRLCDATPVDSDALAVISCNTNEVVSHRNILKTRANVESVSYVNCNTEMQQTNIDSNCKQINDPLDSINKVNAIDFAQSRLIPSLNSQNSILNVSTAELAEHMHSSQTDYVASVMERCVDDDKLLDELEKEFCSTTDAVVGLMDCGSAIHGNPSDNCNDLTKDILMLRQRQTALECVLEKTTESRKRLEDENIRLEQKLQTVHGSLEAAHCDITSLNTELERRVQEHQQDVTEWSERLKQQEENSRQAMEELRDVYQSQLDQMSRAYEDQQHEKDGVVVRYAQAEQRNLELNDRVQKAELKIREWTKERDVALGKWKTLKEEKVKLSELCESRASELASVKKEIEKLKDAVSSADIKVKWHQNKLKAEQDALKECKLNYDKTDKTLKDMTKDFQRLWEQLRAFYMVIQNAENSSSSSSHPIRMDDCKTVNAEEVCSLMRKDFSTLSWKIREVMEELRTYKDKVHCLEAERLSQDNALVTARDDLQCQQTSNSCLRDRISQLEQTESALLDVTVQFTMATQRASELELTKSELEAEIDKLRLREVEKLEFTSRLSEKNSYLQAENTRLEMQIDTLNKEFKSCSEQLAVMHDKCKSLETELINLKSNSDTTIDRLERQLTEQQQHVETSKQRVDELEDEIKTLKRRHSNNIKDLLRQLQQANRKMGMENGTAISGPADSMSLGSIGSHGGSCGSLDTAGVSVAPIADQGATNLPDSPLLSKATTVVSNGDLLSVDEVQALRRALARRNEKMEFLKDHIDHLVEELNRKSNIIRGYIMRDESGALAPESSDRNKAQLSKKGGIMASLYSTQTMDSGMTLGLSLEINNKLQALLEDTLLKNIKLKEGMDTLGKEIDWLMRENGRLKSDAASLVNSEEFSVNIDYHS